jgi:GTP pyrophosphokinase
VLSDINTPKYQERVMRRYGFHDWESVLSAIGQGSIKEGAVVNRMYDGYLADHPVVRTDEDVLTEHQDNPVSVEHPKAVTKSKNGIIVKGLYDVSVRFSKCCSPVPGDEIVGFVTRGRGVSVHRTDCINVINLPSIERPRLIEAEWQPEFLEENKGGKYMADIHIYGNNRTGLLVDISKVFTERNIDITTIHSRTNKQGVATIDVSFGVSSKTELADLVTKLKSIESVIDIERTTG